MMPRTEHEGIRISDARSDSNAAPIEGKGKMKGRDLGVFCVMGVASVVGIDECWIM